MMKSAQPTSPPSPGSAAGRPNRHRRCQVSVCGHGKYLFYVNTEKMNWGVTLGLWRDLSVYIMQRKQPAEGRFLFCWEHIVPLLWVIKIRLQ